MIRNSDNSRPLNIKRYIKLTVSEELPKKTIRVWFNCVKTFGPNGIVAINQTVDDTGHPYSACLIHRETKNGHEYIIATTRDIQPIEVEEIVKNFGELCPNEDFDVETNDRGMLATDKHNISISGAQHLALCLALAKQRHNDWLKERLDAGWRYGTEFSIEAKTHQLLLPWDQLPDRYRVPDMDLPQKFVSLLGDQGYVVVDRAELDRLKAEITSR